MAAKIPDSSSQVCAEKEEFQTTLRITHSRTNDDEAIYAQPINFCMPDNYYIDYEKVVIDNPAKETQSSCGEHTSKLRRKRCHKELPEWIINWDIQENPRRSGSRIDKTYRHKEKGFVCRSLLEAERYEKYGIRTRYCKKKTGDREKGKNKIDNETKEMMANENNIKPDSDEMVMTVEKKEQAKTEELLVAQRKKDAESQRPIVEEFLSKAYYELVHMFDS